MFDNALLESRKTRRDRTRGVSLPLAVGFHAVVIVSLLGAGAWFPGDAPEPAFQVVFPSRADPPPPLGEGGHRGQTRSTPPRQIADSPPTRLPVQIPDVSAASEQTEGPDYPGPEAGGPPGEATGVPGGPGQAPAIGAVVDAETNAPLPIGGEVRAPVLLERIDPLYPEPLRRAGLQGVVLLEAIITASGSVEELRILASPNPLFDEAALKAVRMWRYKPATLNGRAVRVFLTVTIRFGLHS